MLIKLHVLFYFSTDKLRGIFLNALSANPKIEVAMTMPCSEIMFQKRALHKYVHMYAIINMCEAPF